MCRGGKVESVETEWGKFRDIVLECTDDVCGMRRVGRQRRKGSEWFNEEVCTVVAKKRRAFEEWLQTRDRVTYDTESGCETGSPSCQKWRTGDGESDWGMILRITKRCF